MILSLITTWSQMKNSGLLMDVPSPGASCNIFEKFRTCSICLLKSWAAAMLKMSTRKGHQELEEVAACFKHSPMKMWLQFSSSVLLTHQKALWNIGCYSDFFLTRATQLWGPNCSQSLLCYWHYKMLFSAREPIFPFKCSTHLALVWFFLNTKIIRGNLGSQFGSKEGVDVGIKSHMNVC